MGKLFGNKINKTRVFPVSVKIVAVFIIFMLFSNLSTNYINIALNRLEITRLTTQLLVKDLKDIYGFCNMQYNIFQFNENLEQSRISIEKKAKTEFQFSKSMAIGVKPDGSLLFLSTASPIKDTKWDNRQLIDQLNADAAIDVLEGTATFKFHKREYFGIYKYNKKWDAFIIRAEEKSQFTRRSQFIFYILSVVIVILAFISSMVGIFILNRILGYLPLITEAILKMVKNRKMEIIRLDGAPNDDVSFLGVAFNSLSSSINNLLQIFLKFVNKDIAIKAYKNNEVKLEGSERDLTILFSDIKSFTFMTEQLGIGIIKLLNLHYNRAIRNIIKHNGVIGSIIGDAILAVYGLLNESKVNKSYEAVKSAYSIQNVTAKLREQIKERKREIEKTRRLTADEKRVIDAIMISVGVGIDGGKIFYGTIGSYERMTNTVIGDNVNSSSRLEGLTRIYKIPVICSQYVKEDIESIEDDYKEDMSFYEIDTVLVKGKTKGKKVYWPIFDKDLTAEKRERLNIFSEALQLYYDGSWIKALNKFVKCELPLTEVFIDRIKGKKCPPKWKGIWEMKTK